MSAITLYGIPNCDTVKKARRWLEQRQLAYTFHDFRKDGLTEADVKPWLSQLNWESLLNKRSRTWRELAEPDKQLTSAAQAVALCCLYPTLIKRPVLVSGKHVEVGFDPTRYDELFAA